ncbi:ribbon-helix-helix domain-containing protein [Candidatus Woesearchaeota archaeon]|nr:ribbon-helix-helix domain-containing protein [Candidatus Woesearchaeota archaeon]
MANKLISLRIPDTLLNETNKFVKEQGFSSVQEFIRLALREKIDRTKKKKLFEQSKLSELEKVKIRADLEEYINIE